VGLSRLAPESRGPRTPAVARHVLVSPLGLEPHASGSVWLDADLDRTTEAGLPDGQVLRHASVSPWVDESGKPQVIGRAVRRAGDPAPDLLSLVRMTFPEGRVLDRVAVGVLPASAPCWAPGTRARIVFGGGDGRLYRFDFEPADGDAGDDQPRPLAWDCPPPGGGNLQIWSPCWPDDPRFARTILAAISVQSTASPRGPMTPTRIWWLRLDDEGDAIIDAGPVFDPDAIPTGFEAAAPSVGTTPEGGLALAYYLRADRKTWDLHLAPLTIDDAGRPRVASGRVRRLAGPCRPFIPAAFSSDGRWISAVQLDPNGRGMILRLELAADETPEPPPAPRVAGEKWAPMATLVRALLEGCLEIGAGEGCRWD
ncbi:MAG TPA: hypothetical protein VG406_22520, partial [Isosphaeraceae bacterium]|nr:hypothetical protein [Isosphaeraceae bacterium]